MIDETKTGYGADLESTFHKTIKKVTEDIDAMKFNTAIAAMMSLTNDLYARGNASVDELKTLITLLNPFAPHLTEEIWSEFGGEGLLSLAAWPVYDEAKTVDNTVEIAIQVNGKLRGTMMIAVDDAKDAIIASAKENENVKSFIDGKNIVKEIYVPGKLVNIVAK